MGSLRLLEIVEASLIAAKQLGRSPKLVEQHYVCKRQVNYDELVAKATNLKSHVSHLQGKRLGIAVEANRDTLCLIMSLDGIASSIILYSRMDTVTSVSESHKLDGFIDAKGELHWSGINPLNQPSSTAVTGSGWVSTKWGVFTSGTTAEPKLVMHDLADLIRKVKEPGSSKQMQRWGLLFEPHRFAGLQVLLQALIGGDDLVVNSQKSFSQRIEGFINAGVDALSATPSMWRQIMMQPLAQRLQLRQVTLGGEIADQSLLRQLATHFKGARITHIYASTESGVNFSVNDGLAGFPDSWLDKEFADGTQLKILKNELCIKKPGSHAYLPTGDMVTHDPETKRVRFAGRTTGMINVGGNKVYPEQVEQALMGVEGVAQVLAFSSRNTILGALVGINVVPLSGVDESELKRRIQQQAKAALPAWQRPARINFVKRLAMTNAGKILRPRDKNMEAL